MAKRLLIHVFSMIHRVLYQLSRGSMGTHMVGPVLLLTTVGRKSGQFRTTPLLYLAYEENWVVAASYGGDDRHPAWWLNLKVNPAARVQIKRIVRQVRTREATEVERSLLWPRFVNMFSGYEDYRQRTERKIPIVILEPEACESH